MNKSEHRIVLKAKRRAFVEARGHNRLGFDHLSENTIKSFILNDYIISSYSATAFECDIMPALESISLSLTLALPSGESKAEPIRFRCWQPGDTLVKSRLGFMEPLPEAPIVAPDVILTPLLGFDANFARLGQGAGHYDRAFAEYPEALRIGIAWSIQQVERLPTEPWDMPLDAILTEICLHINPLGRMTELR